MEPKPNVTFHPPTFTTWIEKVDFHQLSLFFFKSMGMKFFNASKEHDFPLPLP